jgi:hypothetical protein
MKTDEGMEIELHALTVLPLGNIPPVPTGYKTRWAPRSGRRGEGGGGISCPCHEQTSDFKPPSSL